MSLPLSFFAPNFAPNQVGGFEKPFLTLTRIQVNFTICFSVPEKATLSNKGAVSKS
jgi:hypothetical protein